MVSASLRFFSNGTLYHHQKPLSTDFRAKKNFSRRKKILEVGHHHGQNFAKIFWTPKSKNSRALQLLKRPRTLPGRAFNFLARFPRIQSALYKFFTATKKFWSSPNWVFYFYGALPKEPLADFVDFLPFLL
jgi:hypothetical protein